MAQQNPNAGAPAATPSEASAPVRFERRGASRIITLDRRRARNALDVRTSALIAATVPPIARDADTYAIVLRSSSPGVFCAGGDIRELARLTCENMAAARQAIAGEYRLVWLLDCFSKPVVSLIDGAVLGGGVGVVLTNTHRVAAEAFALSMPEVHIGFFPDDGVAHAFGELPGAMGEYLALTGRRIERADAFALGLVTHCIDAEHFPAIEAALADAQPIDAVLARYHRDPGAAPLAAMRAHVDQCFSGPTVAEIRERLAAVAATSGDAARWAADSLAAIDAASPLALQVTLRHVRNSRALDLRLTLMLDYRLGSALIARPDFREGVRAMVIDKDRSPAWRPAADITVAMVDDIFKISPDIGLNLPTRQEMQAARV